MPDLTSHNDLSVVVFRFNQLGESLEVIKRKLPKLCFTYGEDWIDKEYSFQNLDYTMDFMEPSAAELIDSNTTRISGRIHMPAEKIQLYVNENRNDDDDFSFYYYADVNENGEFVFENLDLKKYAGTRCDIQIGICYDYEDELNFYVDTGMRRHRIK